MRVNGEAREILMRVRSTESNTCIRGGACTSCRPVNPPRVPLQRLAEHGRARRGQEQDAGSALLRDEAVHTALFGPRGCKFLSAAIVQRLAGRIQRPQCHTLHTAYIL